MKNGEQVSRTVLPNAQTLGLLLTHDKTEAEDKLVFELLMFLKSVGFSGELHCRSFIANVDGKVRRPDIFIPRYGLAIEIDGRTRDGWQKRQTDLEPRDQFYITLGLHPPLIVPAAWTVSDQRIKRLKYELKQHLHEERMTPQRRRRVTKEICHGRQIFEKNHPGIFNGSGSLAAQFSADLALNGFTEIRHFGGTKFILRTEYKKKAFPKIDLSPEAVMAHIKRERKKRLRT